jgi:mRNA-degrading endonuclease RelE of RelBE toxin-antitoxin system
MSKTSGSSKKPRRGTKAPTGARHSRSSSRPAPYAVLQSERAEAHLAALEALEPNTYAALRAKLLALKVPNPYAVGTFEKIGDGRYRVRQGDWRALCLADDTQRAILVEAVVRRYEATYP